MFPEGHTTNWAFQSAVPEKASWPGGVRVAARWHPPDMNRIDEPTWISCTALKYRATVSLWSDSIEEKVDFTRWLNVWRKKMTFISRDYGCGCCTHLFDLEGPKAAIDALPEELRIVSAWTSHGVTQIAPVMASRGIYAAGSASRHRPIAHELRG